MCIAGTMVVSLMTVALGNITSLSVMELRVFNEIERRKVKRLHKKNAADLLFYILSSYSEIMKCKKGDLNGILALKYINKSKLAQKRQLITETQIYTFGSSPEGQILSMIEISKSNSTSLSTRSSLLFGVGSSLQPGVSKQISIPVVNSSSRFVSSLSQLSSNQESLLASLRLLIANVDRFGTFLLKFNLCR